MTPLKRRPNRLACLIMTIMAVPVFTAPSLAQDRSPPAQDCETLVRSLADTGNVALAGVNFDFNRSTLRPDSLPALLAARDAVNRLGGAWLIEGHTDNRGGRDYNQRLSETRALAVRNWLVSAGVPAERLSSQGFSLDRPIADNATEEGRARNRRVALVGQADAARLGANAARICAAPTATKSAVEAPAPVSGWQGRGGREWLAYSSLAPSGQGSGTGQRFETVTLPAGSHPETCQAMCRSEKGCAAWSFEPGGSYSVAEARCFRYGYSSELTIRRQNGYQEDGGFFASGLKPDAKNLTPESDAIATAIVADLAEIGALREAVRIEAPETARAESQIRVQLTGFAPVDRYPSLIEIADLGDYVFYWGASRSHQFVHDMNPAGAGELGTPAPGDYTLRYVIEHPTAGRQTIAERPLHIMAANP